MIATVRKSCSNPLLDAMYRLCGGCVADTQRFRDGRRAGNILQKQYENVLIAIIELCLHLIEKYRSIHLTLRVAIDSSPLFQLCSNSNRNFVRCLASQPLTNLSVQCCEGISLRGFDRLTSSLYRFCNLF